MKRSGAGRYALEFLIGFMVLLAASVLTRRAPGPAAPHSAPRVQLGTGDDPNAQAEMEFLMLRDPRANEIPRAIRQREVRLAATLPARRARLFRGGPGRAPVAQTLVWTERGPNNVGGRTRA